jgi:class 3 adenylate cyclase
MFTKFKHKILFLFSLLIIVILATVLLVVNSIYQSQARKQIDSNLERTKLSFEQILNERNRQLATNARLLSLDFPFKQTVRTGDHGTILSAARNHRVRIESDLFLVTDAAGRVLADTYDWKRFGDNISAEPWIQAALRGEENLSLRVIDGELYQLVSLPLVAIDTTIGTLSIGFRINDRVAERLKQMTHTEINFLAGHRVVASTLSDLVRADLEKRLAGLDFDQAMSGDLFQLTLATERRKERFLSILGEISSQIAGFEAEQETFSPALTNLEAHLRAADFPPSVNLSELVRPQSIQAGQGILMTKCVLCHDMQRVVQNLQRTPTEWRMVVENMREAAAESAVLFRMDVSFQSELEDARNISENLRREFADNQIPLSENAIISTEVAGSVWSINALTRNYPIRKEAEELSVYSPKIEDFITQAEADRVTAYLISLSLDSQGTIGTTEILRGFADVDNAGSTPQTSEMLRAFGGGNESQADDSTDADLLGAFDESVDESKASDDTADLLSAFDEAEMASGKTDTPADESELLSAFDDETPVASTESVDIPEATDDAGAYLIQVPAYLIQGSLDEALKPLRKIQRTLLLIGIAAIALSIAVSLMIATGVTSAVRQLVTGTEAVVAGNYSYQLNITQRDEMGQLADHFNEMVAGLRDKERIRAVMDKVVSKEIAEELLKGEVKLGGETRRCTVLFSDIRSWTTISERMEPEPLVTMLNSYLTLMSEAIEHQRGVIDKYIGDAIVALFGAPISHPDDVPRAVNSALEMRRRLAILNAERQKRGEFPLETGIGIHTGSVLAGNIGSESRLNYTVMGDSVNLAARLEGLTKFYGAGILITDAIRDAVDANCLCREIDLIQVVGKTEAIRIFELLEPDPTGKLTQTIEQFESGIRYYREQDWARAEAAFAQTLGGFRNDLASRAYLERIQEFRESPPPPDWDGVYVATEK